MIDGVSNRYQYLVSGKGILAEPSEGMIEALKFYEWREALLKMSYSAEEIKPGVYRHTFTAPDMTMEDVARLLVELPQEE